MNKLLIKVIDDIKKAADEFNIKPQEVTKSQFLGMSSLSEWDLRKLGGLESIKVAYYPQEDKDLGTVNSIQKQKKYIKQLENKLGEKLLNNEKILEVFNDYKLPAFKEYKPKAETIIERAVTLVLSDLHFGSDILRKETGSFNFGKIEESRRFARVIKEVIDYKSQYRENTELHVLLLGDLIQNQLHDERDGAPMAEQVCRAIHLLTQGIIHLSNHFPKVTVHCNSGNHGRNKSRHKDRAVNQKWDSLETIIAFSLKTTFKNVSNVTFNIPQTPYVVYNVFGKKIFATHGDTVVKPGFPGRAINTGSLENQINKINATLKDNDEHSVFIVGHVHTASATHLSNGSTMVTNGALVPSDAYGISIGLMENVCGQMMFESIKGFPVGDMRFIKVTYKDDINKELDKLIKPFNNL